MTIDWHKLILDSKGGKTTWNSIFSSLCEIAVDGHSPVLLHDSTVIPDRLLSEAAWKLWESYPQDANLTSKLLMNNASFSSVSGHAVLILDALSLREMPFILGGAKCHNVEIKSISVTGSESPSTTDQFAKALGASSRSKLANDGKPSSFLPFSGNCCTDVSNLPFEDCYIPNASNVFIWHTWLDDLIHAQKLPDQITSSASSMFQSDGFWSFINKLRQGRNLIITSDHGYAVSKRFSSEVEDIEAVEILRNTFGASRSKPASDKWEKRFMPPIVTTNNGHHIVMGQRKWKVQSGFPHLCHGGLSLLEVAVPYLEVAAI